MAFRFGMGLLAASAIPAEGADVREAQVNPRAPVARTPHPSVTGAPNQIIVPGAAVSPPQLDFGTVWDGDVQTRTVEVAPPAIAPDGSVRVEIEPSKVFSIAEVRVLGPVGEGSRVQADNRNVKPGGQAMLTHDRTRSRTPGAPVVDVTMRRGDTLAIVVQSAPQMSLLRSGNFNGTGPQHALVKIFAQGWRASIPVSAAVGGEGLKATVAASPVCAPYGYRPGVGERHTLQVALESWRPTGVAGQTQLLQAPGGLKEDPGARMIAYRLAPKTRIQMELPYLIYWEGVRFPQTPDQGSTSIAGRGSVKVAYGSASSVVAPFEIVLKPYSRTFHMKGNDGLEWQVDYTIRCDGHFELGWHFFNPNVAVQRDYTFDVVWRGQRLYRGGGTARRNAADKNNVPATGWDFIRDNYEQLLRDPPAARVQYKNRA